jgi:hypothetical protein
MKPRTLEKALLFIVAFAALVVWKSSRYLVSTATTLDSNTLAASQKRISATANKNKSNNHQRLKSDDLPIFLLHIGPPKTATTTIQCGLHHLSKSLAEEDSYFYVGKSCPQYGSTMENNETSVAGHHLLMGLNGGNPQTRGYIALKERMDHHLAQHHNMIYSNEGFAHHLEDKNVTWQCMQSLFDGWHVRIVIGYRHYFEWIRSLYYQQYLNPKKYKLNWPGQKNKGLEHPSFLWYLDYHLHRFETGNLSKDGGHHAPAFGHHLSLSTYKKFVPYFDDIQFFNLYGEGDLVTNFVCEMLPDVQHTCQSLQSHQRHTASDALPTAVHGLNKRASKSFDAQRIAEAAFEQGIVGVSSPKPSVVERIEEKIAETRVDTNPKFLSCPSSSLEERFFNASLTFELEMLAIHHPYMPPARLKEAQNTHRNMFDASKAGWKFCEINPQVVLQDKAWQTFLSDVGATTATTKETR